MVALKNKKSIFILLILLIFLFGCIATKNSSISGENLTDIMSIKVRVNEKIGESDVLPVADAKIEIYNYTYKNMSDYRDAEFPARLPAHKGELIRTAYTNVYGIAEFKNLTKGTYIVEVSKENYYDEMRSTNGISDLDINLWYKTECSFQDNEFECQNYALHASTSGLDLEINPCLSNITITGIVCTQNTSPGYLESTFIGYKDHHNFEITYGGYENLSKAPRKYCGLIFPTYIYLAKTNDVEYPWREINCTDVSGKIPSDTTVGTTYSGRIYINYTEHETGTWKIAVGKITTKFGT